MKKLLLLTISALVFHSSFSQTYIGLLGGITASKTNIDEQTETLLKGFSSYKVERFAGIHYGVLVSNGLGTRGKLNLQTGFNVVQKGYAVEFGVDEPSVGAFTFERDYNIQYYEIPLLARLVLGKAERKIDPYVIGGIYAGIAKKAQVTYEASYFDYNTGVTDILDESTSDHLPYNKDDLEASNIFMNGKFLSDKRDMGYTFGGGFAFNLGRPKLFIEAKSSRSFKSKSIFKDYDGAVSNPKIQNNTFYVSLGLMFSISKPKQAAFDFDN